MTSRDPVSRLRGVGQPRPRRCGPGPWLALLAVMPACTTLIVPPAMPVDPVTVYVADHGYHASLLLPREGGRFVAYAYGEHDWFARDRNAWWRVVPALCWPTPGTLGRRSLADPGDATLLAAHSAAREPLALDVPGAAVRLLIRDLDARFAAQADASFYNRLHRMTFVPDAEPYWLGHGCNTVLARWLRRLGCRVSGSSCWAAYRVQPQREGELAARRSGTPTAR